MKRMKWCNEHKRERKYTFREYVRASALVAVRLDMMWVWLRVLVGMNQRYSLLKNCFRCPQELVGMLRDRGSFCIAHDSNTRFGQSGQDFKLRQCSLAHFWWNRLHCYESCPSRGCGGGGRMVRGGCIWIADRYCPLVRSNRAVHPFSRKIAWSHHRFYVKWFCKDSPAESGRNNLEDRKYIL